VVELGRADSQGQELDPQPGETAVDLYRTCASALSAAGVPFLVGGSYALGFYTPVGRPTKDFDLFVRAAHVAWALRALADAGFDTELCFPHWLGKARRGQKFIDIIFASGNGVAIVDDEWFTHAVPAQIFGLPMQLCPPEEMLWSKAFVCERERYDGADVVHLLRDCGGRLDWQRLLRRFGEHWRVLYAHIITYGFVFPALPEAVPAWVHKELAGRLADEQGGARLVHVCRGTLLSREQYLVDVEQLGYRDGRLEDPAVRMTAEDIARWTEAIPGRSPNHVGQDCVDPGRRR
jgi:hypothetical protein